MKRFKYFIVLFIIIVIYIQIPSFQWLKSLSVMKVSSIYEKNTSVLHDEGIKISIPGGITTIKQDWYPFVITFNDDAGFSEYMNRNLRMTVLYNFGYFPFYRGYSAYYDINSSYYNSFYGAYIIKAEGGEPFGYKNGEVNIEEIGKIPTYDMKHLVLKSIGARNPVFSYEMTGFKDADLLNESEWQVFDANLHVTGSLHEYQGDKRAYIQYGRPPVINGETNEYEVIDMKARIYSKYYEEKDISIFFYCITKELETINEWEEKIMSRSKVIFK